jgi:hypothetical protein
LLPTVLYNVRGAWRSVNEPAFFGGAGSGETDQHFLSSKLTEPRANQQGKRVRVFRKFKILIFVQINQLLMH